MDHPEPLSPAEWRRAWRIITLAGFLGTTYYLLCVSGAPRVKYLTELKATPLDFGIMTTLGALVLAFQIVGSMIANSVARRKRIWIVMTIIHRLLFLGVLLAPLLFDAPRLRIAWIIFVLFCHDSLAQVCSPIWLSWMADLVPTETMSRHWAARQRTITAATILVMILIAFGFHHFEMTNRVILGFTILGGIGVVLGVTDILLFIRVPEPSHEPVTHTRWSRVLLQPVRDPDYRRFLFFMGYWQFGIFLAAPFFGLYLLSDVNLSVRTVQLLGTASALGVVVSSRFWGLVCDVYGYRPVLQILSLAKVFTPAAYLLAPRAPVPCVVYFTVIWFIDGLINSGIALAFQGPMLKFTPRANRTMYIAAANFFAVGIMASLAPVVSGYIIETVNALDAPSAWWGQFNGYHVAFAASLVFRATSCPLAGRIVEPTAAPVRLVIRQVFSFNSMYAAKWAHRLHDAHGSAVRERAAKQLGVLRNPIAIGELIAALRDSSSAVRDAAADALGQIGSSQATQALVDALFDARSGIQSPAARALGRIGDADALRALVRYLHDGGDAALTEIVDSLARIGDDAAILPLICLFNKVEDETLHARIATALATISRAGSLNEVIGVLRSSRPSTPMAKRGNVG